MLNTTTHPMKVKKRNGEFEEFNVIHPGTFIIVETNVETVILLNDPVVMFKFEIEADVAFIVPATPRPPFTINDPVDVDVDSVEP